MYIPLGIKTFTDTDNFMYVPNTDRVDISVTRHTYYVVMFHRQSTSSSCPKNKSQQNPYASSINVDKAINISFIFVPKRIHIGSARNYVQASV